MFCLEISMVSLAIALGKSQDSDRASRLNGFVSIACTERTNQPYNCLA